MKVKKSNFHLNKWFLDFIGNNGETMIFYAATLSFKGVVVHYASWINYNFNNGVTVKSHFRNVNLPEKTDELITWFDDKFKVSGSWQSLTKPIKARIFNDEEGYLDWHCWQPASKVKLNINNKNIEGHGYAEQLILTTPPWHIPMHDLRWGRFQSSNDTVVWIELRKEIKQQWLWLNGHKIMNATIEDDFIESKENKFFIKLDRSVVLESEKKIFHVVETLLKYLPGFNQIMPIKFLMATNNKWLSKGELERHGQAVTQGMAIHEWVNFNTKN